MLTDIKIDFDEVTDIVLATDGIAAALDRRPEPLTVLGDCHRTVLDMLIPQAAAWLAAQLGLDCSADTTDGVITLHGAPAALAGRRAMLVAAMAWRVMHLVFTGVDASRADRCAVLADDCTDTLAATAITATLRKHWS